ncbi:hypothetical protein [Virgibacillus sp. JSM 102003]|uniref:hypothetical protein n=1 Tax=Virgibacillus sp. JSM 102003 TaxID=1562108 RepID=UPI0035C1D2E2
MLRSLVALWLMQRRILQKEIDKYYSTEGILLALIEPKIHQFVKNQYGKEMIVNPLKVYDVSMVQEGIAEKGKNIEGWFQLDMSILVGEPSDNPTRDRIILKVDAPHIGGSVPPNYLDGGEIGDIKVELVKYIKG